jgi:hypothetical protein
MGFNKSGAERTHVQAASGGLIQTQQQAFRVTGKERNLTGWGTVRISRRNLLRGLKIITLAKKLFYFNLIACQITKFRISQPLFL